MRRRRRRRRRDRNEARGETEDDVGNESRDLLEVSDEFGGLEVAEVPDSERPVVASRGKHIGRHPVPGDDVDVCVVGEDPQHRGGALPLVPHEDVPASEAGNQRHQKWSSRPWRQEKTRSLRGSSDRRKETRRRKKRRQRRRKQNMIKRRCKGR